MNSNNSVRSLWAFRAVAFLRAAAEGFFVIALPFQAIRLGAGPRQLGIIGGIAAVSYTLACLVSGRVMKHRPLRATVLVSLSIASVVTLGIAYSPSLSLIYALLAIYGAAVAFFWPQVMTWLATHTDGGGLTRELGAFNLSWCLGIPLGILTGGHLFEIDPALPYLASFVGSVAAIGVIAFMTRPAATVSDDSQDAPFPEQPTDGARARMFLIISWLGLVGSYYALGNIRYQLPKLVKSVGMSEGTFGNLLFLLQGAQVLTFLILMRTERWHFKRSFLWCAQFCVVLGIALVSVSVAPVFLVLSFILVGAGLAVVYSSSQYYGIRSPLGRGQRTAIHESVIGGGLSAGTFCGGLFAHSFGLRTPYLVAAAFLLLLLLAQIVIDGSRRRSDRSPSGN